MPETFTEIDWSNVLKDRSEAGFKSLYNAYSGALYGIIHRIVQSVEASNDVLQETFIKIWKNSESYNSSKGTLFTWMLNIARNSAIDHTRSKGYRNQNQNQIDNVVIENYGKVEIPIDQIGMKDHIALLKPELQQILEILYFQGYTHEEASEALQLPLGTVKTRARTAILQLRTILQP
ncbi:MAG: sigma-70 family RNA polymerase sigma factor [Saprospiraceae bacterium]